jgi:hypothetical protein
MSRQPITATALAACLIALAGPAVAGTGAIPIYGPTIIDQPGLYELTRDITTDSYGIIVDASPVTIDLQGHHLTTTGASPAVSLMEGAGEATVRNGSISGVAGGVSNTTATQLRLHLHDLDITTQANGVYASGVEYVEVTNCRIHGPMTGSGLRFLAASGTTFSAVLTGNVVSQVRESAITLNGCSGGTIRGNVLSEWDTDSLGYPGLHVSGEGAVTIADNVLEKETGARRGVSLLGDAFRVTGNTITVLTEFGINVQGANNWIHQNLVEGAGGVGISAAGRGNLVDANRVAGFTTGLDIGGIEAVYRGNVLHGNSSSLQNSGGAIDGGDNIGYGL